MQVILMTIVAVIIGIESVISTLVLSTEKPAVPPPVVMQTVTPIVSPSITSVPSPTISPLKKVKVVKKMLDSGKVEYSIPEFELAFTLPAELAIDGNYGEPWDGQTVENSITIAPKIAVGTGEPLGSFFYISVIPKGFITQGGDIYNHRTVELELLSKIKVGEKVNVSEVVEQGFVYQRLPDEKISSYTAKTFVNTSPWESGSGTKEYRSYVETSKFTYLFGAYVDYPQPKEYQLSQTDFTNFLSTVVINEQSR